MANPVVENVNLFFMSGGSDKVYQASIEESDGGYLVNFAYGRRGASLKTGTKTKEPVDLEKARKIYEKLVSSKTSKGYKPGGDVGTYTPDAAQFDAEVSEAQLLNSVELDEVDALVNDPAFVAQEKHDGKRLMVGRKSGEVYALNRKGKSCGFPKVVADAVRDIPGGDFLLDGEAVGERYWAFDALEVDGKDIRGLSYDERNGLLGETLETIAENEAVTHVETARTAEEKQALIADVRNAEREGVVFKRRDAVHSRGRPNSGGDQLKFKFTESCTARVVDRNGSKRSVSLELLDENDSWVGVGNVTVPANLPIPEKGDLVEVRYLYAYKGGSLFQPVLLGKRDDLEVVDCSMDQLKYKPESQTIKSERGKTVAR